MLIVKTLSKLNLRKITISTFLLGFTVFTFASIGGDKNKSKGKSIPSGISSIHSSHGFSLKEGFKYRGSLRLKQEKTANYIAFNSLVTYQKGNTTYIMPNKYKISVKTNETTTKSSLQLLQLRIKLCK
jgi:hypothetical protein